MLYVILGVLLVGICYFALPRKTANRQEEQHVSSVREQPTGDHFSKEASLPNEQEVSRTFVPGPKLTRDDDAFYALVHAAIAQTLAAEGINPEGGFAIRAIKPVYDAMQPPLVLRENEALYAVIAAAVAKVLAAEGVNPEGGFVIQSIQPV